MKKTKHIFIKTHEVDKERFAELLEQAKGVRTMKDFAESCGVNPSTFTRIVKKTNKGSSSVELLEAIADNALPGSGVTLELLADANGYTLDKDNGIKARRLIARNENYESVVRNVLIQELLDRNQEVRIGKIVYDFGKTMSLKPDVLIRTGAFGNEDDIWFIDSILFSHDTKNKPINTKSLKRMALDRIGRFNLISMSKQEFLRPNRFSLVFFDRDAYDVVVEEFSEPQVATRISFILIDTLNNRIEDEVMLPLFSEGPQESYFMTTPVCTNDKDDDLFRCEVEDYEEGDI